jgi:hypothetical protein
MQAMEILLLATGITGTFTLIWLFRLVKALFVSGPVLQIHPGAGLLDRLLREISSARREILLCADSVRYPALAEALLAAQWRRVQVELMLGTAAEADPQSTLGMLLDNQLVPLIDDHSARLACQILLIDGRSLFLSSGAFDPEEEQCAGGLHLVEIRHQPEVIGACRELLSGIRTRSRPARVPFAASPVSLPSSLHSTRTPPSVGELPPIPPSLLPPLATPVATPVSPALPREEPASMVAPLAQPVLPSQPIPEAEAEAPATEESPWPAYGYHDPDTASEPVSETLRAMLRERAASVEEPDAEPASVLDTEPEPVSQSQPAMDPLPASTPPVRSMLSRSLATFEPPAGVEEELARRPSRRDRRPVLIDEESDNSPATAATANSSVGAPPVTQAAAELFARLRREVQSRGNKPIAPPDSLGDPA